jgi:hypothetical protein
MSCLLQFEGISWGVPISVVSQQQKAYCHHKSQNRIPMRNAGNYQL